MQCGANMSESKGQTMAQKLKEPVQAREEI
jgi:hypothetical protein